MTFPHDAERRRLQRLPLQGRVTGQYSNGGMHELHGTSKNVSAEGMFLLVDAQVAEGARVELALEMPSQPMFRHNVTLRCVGRVIRAEAGDADGSHGIAVLFEDVEIRAAN